MKKTLTLIFTLFFAIVVTSCKKNALNIDPTSVDNITYNCWLVTIEHSDVENKATESWHEWNTECALVISLQKKYGSSGCKAYYKVDTKYADELSCKKADENGK